MIRKHRLSFKGGIDVTIRDQTLDPLKVIESLTFRSDQSKRVQISQNSEELVVSGGRGDRRLSTKIEMPSNHLFARRSVLS